MLARVSHLESFRRWRDDDGQTVADLVARLTEHQPTERMLVGTAFHRALELAKPGRYDTMEAEGYTFTLPKACIALPTVRELRASKAYGLLTVTGQVDGIDGLRIEDHKTTAQMDAEGYFDGYQWRFYLDIFGADVFRWNVFELKPPLKKDPPKTYRVGEPQHLTQYRYPGMGNDCSRLAHEFCEFVRTYLQTEEQEHVFSKWQMHLASEMRREA